MNVKNLIATFEDLVFTKSFLDIKDIQAQTKPTSFPEYFLEYFVKKYAIPGLVKKKVSQFLRSVKKFSESFDYIFFISQLLQLSSHEPIDYTFSLYCCQVLSEFNELVRLKDFKTKISNSSKVFIGSEGGTAFLSDVFSLVYKIFPKKKFASLMIESLRPDYISKESYILFTISHKISKLRITPDQVFDLIDSKRKNSLPVDFVIKGMIHNLNIWIPNESFTLIYNAFECSHTDLLTKERFLSKFDLKIYENEAKNERFIISKLLFVRSLFDLYSKTKIKTAAYLMRVFDTQSDEFMNFKTFKAVIKAVNSKLSYEFVKSLYEEGLKSQELQTGLKKEAFVSVMIKYGVGDKGLMMFCKDYLASLGLKPNFSCKVEEHSSLSLENFSTLDSSDVSIAIDKAFEKEIE